LGGGGTDLPSYYKMNEGFVIAAAINKYVYTSISRPFSPGIYLKYAEIETTNSVSLVRHPIIRESLRYLQLRTPQIEISTFADIHSGTGLGSSGSFTTSLLKGLFTHYKKSLHTQELAELACLIEIEKLKEPVGKQDQFISAFGGITSFNFKKDGTVVTSPINISIEMIQNLEDHLLLYYTGTTRSASTILHHQNDKSLLNDKKMTKNLDYIKELGEKIGEALLRGSIKDVGELFDIHWNYKKERSPGMSNKEMDSIYDYARNNGAIGGKLVGAGGGGFFLFVSEEKSKLRSAMDKMGLEEVRFGFDFEGTKVVHS
jgi:D-glycero-alpha-D-manno-heptose-7-phosphate kinase